MRVNVLDENGMLTWKLTIGEAELVYGAVLIAQTVGRVRQPQLYDLQRGLLTMIARGELALKDFHNEQKPPSSGKEDVMETEVALGGRMARVELEV